MTERKRKKAGSRLASSYDKLKKAYKELKSAHAEMTFRMALMAELRDPQTGAHLVRIADYSAVIAEGLGLPKEEIETLRYASPMHDVGKIVLPDVILKKEGKLTSREKTLMRDHPEAGFEVFKNARSPIMKACGVIALTHHERFDGTGYPQGLKGEDIPLYGRIVALADCFDAYTSKRTYKEAIAFEEAISMVKERAGTHFDPVVVRAFLRNKKRVKKIWEANQDIDEFVEEIGKRLKVKGG